MSEAFPGAGSAGSLLRAAREKQGLHIAALAAAIKVSPRKLEALESGRYDELPDATFTRALAQTVCRTLKMDARAVLDLLPPSPSVALEPGSGGLGTPFRDRPGRNDPTLSLGAVKPLVWLALVLVLAAVALYFVPGTWWSGGLSTPTAAPAPASTPLPAAATATASMTPAASGPVQAGAVAAPETAGETVFAAPALAGAASEAGNAAPAGAVQLRSTEASWVEVRDARGQLLLSRTVLPGEGVGLDGALPLRLVIGNASATQLGFRGQAVDLVPHTRDNVARVELQ